MEEKSKKIDPCRQRQTFRQWAKIPVRAEYHNLTVANKRISKKIFFRSCFSKAKKIFLLVESDTFQSRRKAGGGGGSERAQGQFCFLLCIGVFSRKKQNPLLLRSVRSERDCAKNSGPGRARKEKTPSYFRGDEKEVLYSAVLLYSRCVSNEQATTKYISVQCVKIFSKDSEKDIF